MAQAYGHDRQAARTPRPSLCSTRRVPNRKSCLPARRSPLPRDRGKPWIRAVDGWPLCEHPHLREDNAGDLLPFAPLPLSPGVLPSLFPPLHPLIRVKVSPDPTPQSPSEVHSLTCGSPDNLIENRGSPTRRLIHQLGGKLSVIPRSFLAPFDAVRLQQQTSTGWDKCNHNHTRHLQPRRPYSV